MLPLLRSTRPAAINVRVAVALFLTALLSLAAVYAARRPRAKTVISALPYVISQPGNYQLGADLIMPVDGPADKLEGRAMIRIDCPGVTLNFNGHRLSGPDLPDSDLVGVYAYDQANLVIKNGTIEHCFIGVMLDGEPGGTRNVNQRVENLLVTHGYHIGVDLNNARGSLVRGCLVSAIGPSPRIDFACGIAGLGEGIAIRDNVVSDVIGRDVVAFGIFSNSSPGVVAISNAIFHCRYGINAGEYKDNLTGDCATPFFNGTDAGGNH